MKKFLPWLASLAILVVGFGTVYGVAQQGQRRDANYPQVQLAEDVSAGYAEGALSSTLIGNSVDMAKSLAPFTIIYDKTGRVVLGSGYLNGKVAKAPLGILQGAKGKEYNAVTWQPQSKVRIAAVTVAGKDYYVLSGRNLREVEKNESHSFQLSVLGGLLSVLLLAVVFISSGALNDEY